MGQLLFSKCQINGLLEHLKFHAMQLYASNNTHTHAHAHRHAHTPSLKGTGTGTG